jgi:hypothetical protein
MVLGLIIITSLVGVLGRRLKGGSAIPSASNKVRSNCYKRSIPSGLS